MIIVEQDCNLDQLNRIAARLAGYHFRNSIIYLYGELAAGKTTFVKQYLLALGFDGVVKSPTYTLVEPYTVEGQLIYHFDLYRLHHPQELYEMGIEDYFTDHSQVIIEWPDNGADVLPQPDVTIYLQKTADIDVRQIKIVATSAKAIKLLQGFE